ncbi:glycosyltransferase [Fontivita pretiosa]|uniref:glycosyltransferase n=1 Tax=Fontivita pretiosa TaxID=2989684 RepID=UPI003D168FD5
MGAPLVSVIIPCFNAGRFVGDAIRSALRQTYRPIEVIVLNDGSTDESEQIIRSFGDSIRCESSPNRGACAARNRGLAMSRGELIQFLDADDLLHPEKVARQVKELSDDETIAFGPWLRFSCRLPAPPYEPDICAATFAEDLLLQWLQGKYVICNALLWPARLLSRIGGWDARIVANQDGELLMRALSRGARLKYRDDAWAFYRVPTAGGNMAARTDAAAQRSRLRVMWRVYRWNTGGAITKEVLLRFWQHFVHLGASLIDQDPRYAALAFRLARRARSRAGCRGMDPTRLMGYAAYELSRHLGPQWGRRLLMPLFRACRERL